MWGHSCSRADLGRSSATARRADRSSVLACRVAGPTSGIGRALAEDFHRRGNRVIIAGRRQHLLDAIIAAHPGMIGMELDVQDSADVEAFAARVRKQSPELNILINNVGISRSEDLTAAAIDLTEARSIIQTNVVSILELTAALLPIL